MTLVEAAAKKAKELHQGTNHKYDGKDYFETHILRVVQYAEKYLYLIPVPEREYVLAAIYLHDAVEDCRITYGDVERWFGKKVADIVYALSNEKGKTRKERANKKYYKGIRGTRFATFGKLVDRFGNVSYSQEKGSTMFTKYKEEQPSFEKSLKGTHSLFGRIRYAVKTFFAMHETDYSRMFEDLNEMFKTVPSEFKINYTEA